MRQDSRAFIVGESIPEQRGGVRVLEKRGERLGVMLGSRKFITVAVVIEVKVLVIVVVEIGVVIVDIIVEVIVLAIVLFSSTLPKIGVSKYLGTSPYVKDRRRGSSAQDHRALGEAKSIFVILSSSFRL